MDTLAAFGSLMGLAFSSGVRLYSTVLAVGLGIRLGYLQVPPRLDHLRVLASTPVLIIAGITYLVEFFADKIPWVDTLWDMGHTFIRPLGAAVLAVTALGAVDPVVKVSAFLLSGAVALSGHSAKAGTRFLANQSPEPLSNIGLSLGEDALVVSGVWLALTHPLISLALVVVLVGIVLWLLPRLFGLLRRQVAWIRAHGFRAPARGDSGLAGSADGGP